MLASMRKAMAFVLSLVLVGTPSFGACPQVPPQAGTQFFQRGDSNNDRAIDLTDGVFILNYLFKGGPEPSCLDSADTDDNGRLDLTDAVFVLQYLFLGGPAPPDPGPATPGLDPTEDGVSCATGIQGTVVMGRILKRQSEDPVVKCAVRLGQDSAETDRDGRFSFFGAAQGEATLTVDPKAVDATLEIRSLSIRVPSTGLLDLGEIRLWREPATAFEFLDEGKRAFDVGDLEMAHGFLSKVTTPDAMMNHEKTLFSTAASFLRFFDESADRTIQDPSKLDLFPEILDAFCFSDATHSRRLVSFTAAPPHDKEGKIVLDPGSPTSGDLQKFLQDTVVPRIRVHLADLETIPKDFKSRYSTTHMGDEDVMPEIEIDFTDITLFRAVLHLVLGLSEFLLAHDLGLQDAVDIDAILAAAAPGRILWSEELLSKHPGLLKLIDAAAMARAKEEFREALERYIEFSDLLRAEQKDSGRDPQDDELIAFDSDSKDPTVLEESMAQEDEIRRNIEAALLSLDGAPAVLEIDDFTLDYNLGALLASGKGLRDFLPELDAQTQRMKFGTFPDPTLAGFLPGKTQDSLARLLHPTVFFDVPVVPDGQLKVDDGSLADWAGLGLAPVYRDPTDDVEVDEGFPASLAASFEIQDVYIARDSEWLYVRVDFKATPDPKPQLGQGASYFPLYGLFVEGLGNGFLGDVEPCGRCYLELDNGQFASRCRQAGQSGANVESRVATGQGAFELRVSLDLLDKAAPGERRLFRLDSSATLDKPPLPGTPDEWIFADADDETLDLVGKF